MCCSYYYTTKRGIGAKIGCPTLTQRFQAAIAKVRALRYDLRRYAIFYVQRFTVKFLNRTALAFCMLLGVFVAAFSSAETAYSQGGALATNTRRPTQVVIPTNTRRPSATPTVEPTATHTPTLTPTPTVIGPVTYPDNINPLTGLPYPSEEARNRRNLIVKVSNFPYIVRPQSGLDKADIVYEYEVEGGTTRFAAIYRSQGAEHVGSVRSGRLLDLELVVMYNALFAYSGVNDAIKALIGEAEWKYQTITPQFGDNCPPFCRFPMPGVPFEHTLFGNTFQMWQLATRRNVNQGYVARGFAFDETPDEGGTPINDIFIKWYGDQNMRWQYNPADGKYYRWNTGYAHVDAITGQQLTADNVVIVQAYHVDRPDIYESESGAKTVEIQLWGREKAIVCRDGRCYEGVWIRRSRERYGTALALFYADGQTPIKLKPGQTWVQVVRCCSMFGVELSKDYVDVFGTGTPAAATATARAPRLPPEAQTQQAFITNQTSTASAATAQWNRQPTLTPDLSRGTLTPTPTPRSVGQLP